MTRRLALTAVLGGAAALWPAAALAATGPLVTPTSVGQSENPATCAAAGLPGTTFTITDDNNQQGTHTATDGTASITVTISGTSVSFGPPEALPTNEKILGVVVKGGSNGGNLYNYESLGGVTADNNLNAGPTGNGGETAGVSHILLCYGVPSPSNTPSGTTPGTPPPGTTTTTTTPKTTTATTPTTSLSGATATKHKKHKKHKKAKKHSKAKTMRRVTLPTFTG